MSLRIRLFLMLGGLIVLLVVAQWWFVRSLMSELSYQVGLVAVSVGESVAAALDRPATAGEEQETGAEAPSATTEHVTHVGIHDRGTSMITVPGTTIPGNRSLGRAGASPSGKSQVFTFKFDSTGPKGAEERHMVLHLGHEGVITVADHPIHIPIPEEGLLRSVERLSRQLLVGTGALLLFGLGLAAVLAHRVTAPLSQLAKAAQRVGDGELGAQLQARASGEVAQTIAAFNHMSRRLQELDDETRRLNAQRHLGEIGEVARGLAHTLRNPLNALGLSLDELAAHAPQGDELAVSARRQIRRIDGSIRSLLALTSEGRGAAAAIDITALAHDVALEALQDCRDQVSIQVDADGAGTQPRMLRAIEPELRAVLQALVVNAVEASPQDGEVKIELQAVAANRLRIVIDDAGPGLAPDVRARLFTPHVSTKPHGSGMGLFLAHRIATTRYRGHLELQDRQPGTRVVLELGAVEEPSSHA